MLEWGWGRTGGLGSEIALWPSGGWHGWRRSREPYYSRPRLGAFGLGSSKLPHPWLLLQLTLSHGVEHLASLLTTKRVWGWRVAWGLNRGKSGRPGPHLGLGWGFPPGRASLGSRVPARRNGDLARGVERRPGAQLGLLLLELELLEGGRVELSPGLQGLHVVGRLGRHGARAVGASLGVLELLLDRHAGEHWVHCICGQRMKSFTLSYSCKLTG